MPDITGSINSKGLDKTGFDDDLIAELFHRKVGRHMLAIVEVQIVDKRGPNIKGKSKVMLDITRIDPVTDDNLDEHLREIQKTLAYNRGLEGHTGTTTQGQEPSVDQVLAAGQKHKPHPFLPVDAADENPICDVCGHLEATAVHSVQETLEEDPVPDDEADQPDDDGDIPGDDDAVYEDMAQEIPADNDEPWEYDGPEGADADPKTASTVPDPFAVTT